MKKLNTQSRISGGTSKPKTYSLKCSEDSRSPMSMLEEGCTAFSVSGQGTYTGFPLIGGTSDNSWTFRASLVYRVPEKGYAYLSAETSEKGILRAMNDRGFCFSRNAIFPNTEWIGTLGDENGLTNEQFALKLATECATVEDAISLLQNTTRHSSVWKSFIFADSYGKCQLVQVTPDDFELLNPDAQGWASVTNHFLSDKLKKYDHDGTGKEDISYWQSSWTRYTRTMQLRKTMKNKKADPYVLMDFLSDTENLDVEQGVYQSICSHGKDNGTIFGFILQPALKTFWYCYGPPDGKIILNQGTWGRFVPFAVPQLQPGQYVTEEGVVSPEYPSPFAQEHLR